jgi:hypothetical protein
MMSLSFLENLVSSGFADVLPEVFWKACGVFLREFQRAYFLWTPRPYCAEIAGRKRFTGVDD